MTDQPMTPAQVAQTMHDYHVAVAGTHTAQQQILVDGEASRTQTFADGESSRNLTVSDGEAARNAQVMAMYETMAKGVARLEYDNSVYHTKASLALPVDASSNGDMTEWGAIAAIQGSLIVGRMSGLNVLDTQAAVVTAPGHYDDPQYSNDISRTNIEVLISNQGHADIQDYLAANPDVKPARIVGWNSGAFNWLIPSITNSYGMLYVRFVNLRYDDAEVLSGQDINAFGGNSSLRVSAVSTFNPL